MDAFLTPVLLGAILTSAAGALGWFVTFRNTQKLDVARRAERVQDFQIALRAEIASELMSLDVIDLDEHFAIVQQRYRDELGYSVLVSQLSANLIFDAIVKDIHILPAAVIGPVVHYARMRQTTILFAGDLRDERFRTLSTDRQLAMYADYLQTLKQLRDLAQEAAVALDRGMNALQ